jgi:PilZ domain/Putative zinc-finger
MRASTSNPSTPRILSDGPGGRGEFLHPSDNDLEQYLRLSLSPEQSAVVYHHLFTCEECRDKAREFAPPARDGQGKTIPERRKDARASLTAPLSLRVLDPSARLLEGQLLNVSTRGLKIQVPEALEPGVTVQIRLGGKIIMAEVRYCSAHHSPDKHGFHVGVKIQDVFPIPGKGSVE